MGGRLLGSWSRNPLDQLRGYRGSLGERRWCLDEVPGGGGREKQAGLGCALIPGLDGICLQTKWLRELEELKMSSLLLAR